MNGAQSLVTTLADSGIEVCFANPGTSEMHFVAALDREPRIRGILGLFEGVVTGACDGYARMAGKPALALLHLGPGFANGIANLHNARQARTPIVNVVGDHASSHAKYAHAPLTSDIMGICRTVSHWLVSAAGPSTAASDGARAVAAARGGQIATLILPADAAWGPAEAPAPPLPVAGPAPVSDAAIARAAAALKTGKRTALLMRGPACQRTGLDAAGRIAAKTGARVMHDFFSPRVTRGAGMPKIERIPYFAEQIVESFKGLEQIILVGAPPPVTFFAYEGRPSWVTPDGCDLITLSHPHEDAVAALMALADAVGAPKTAPLVARVRPDMPRPGALDAFSIGLAIARFLPENVILVDEAATSSGGFDASIMTAPAHDVLYLTGGAIGHAHPTATGAAVACPDRKVLAVTGDGGAMYAPQALWTQARERLDVTTVICANRSYAILNVEIARVGVQNPGPKALSLFDMHDPVIDWVKMAESMGVEASRAETVEDFARQFESAMKGRGPRLIEAVL